MMRSGLKSLAVLGGGISGLTAAYTLARTLPRDLYRIVVIEAQSRLGGYVASERVPIYDDAGQRPAMALYEWGPRSIRPVGYRGRRTVELISQLGLTDRMVMVPRSSVSAQNRFLFAEGRLQRIPSSLFSALIATVRMPILWPALAEASREWRVPRYEELAKSEVDESVHDFFCRRFGSSIANTFVSAMIHGIYAGDPRELSVKAVMPALVRAEQTHGSLLRSLLPPRLNAKYRAPKHLTAELALQRSVESRLNPALVQKLASTSIYSFPQGIAEMTQALQNELMAMPNVEIWRDAACEQIKPCKRIEIVTKYATQPLHVDRLVAAIPSQALAPLIPDLPHLQHNPAANLAVVDIVLGAPDGSSTYELPIRGFGYLVPRSTQPNRDEIIGVVLDSDAVPNQRDSSSPNAPSFIKLTVMMGGPHWRHRVTLPTEDEAKERALRALHMQLGIPLSVLTSNVRHIRSRVMRNTIPQYLVGHTHRMSELHAAVTSRASPWYRRLTLLGNSYGGVGVNDCIAQAMDTCEAICQEELGMADGEKQYAHALADTTGIKSACFQS